MADPHVIWRVPVGQVLGLVEAIDEVGGVADAATISQEVEMDLDRLGPVIDSAEFLGLIRVEDGDLKATDLSRRLLKASVKERKAILRGILEKVPLFRQVVEMARKAGRPLARREVLEVLAAQIGGHAAEDLFTALVYWGRYVELLRYDSESERLTLREPST